MSEIGMFFVLAVLAVLVFIAIVVGAIYVSIHKTPHNKKGSGESHD